MRFQTLPPSHIPKIFVHRNQLGLIARLAASSLALHLAFMVPSSVHAQSALSLDVGARSIVLASKPETPAVQDVEIVHDWTTADAGIIWADDFEATGSLSP